MTLVKYCAKHLEMHSTTTYNIGFLKLTAVYFRVLFMRKLVSIFCVQHTVLSKFDDLIGLLFRGNQHDILSLKFLRSLRNCSEDLRLFSEIFYLKCL